MNCREFIIEFEDRGTLSEPATLHLTICADCRKLSERQTQIWLMIDGLKPVAAPSDFDFHVKAKIANAKPSDFQSPRFLPILRYVLPLSVVILLLGLFAYNSASFFGNSTAPQIAQAEKPNANSVLPVNLSLTNQAEYASTEEDKMVVKPKTTDEKSLIAGAIVPNAPETGLRKTSENSPLPSHRSVKLARVITQNSSGGGSRDTALSSSSIQTPRGINLNANAANAPKIDSPKPVSDDQALSIIGIKFVSENGKRTVEAVQANSIADKSGVKVGDVIEKIKDNALTVLRGTEKLEITLRNDFNQKP